MTEITLEVENIGGIDEAHVSFEGGVTLVRGPNATNKTSLLQGLLFALGVSRAPIRSSADTARVRLAIGDRTVERTATRTGRGVQIDGEAWVTDSDDRLLLERLAALLETNPLRAAVSREQEIEPLLKEPMDIDALEAKRSEKMQRRRELNDKIEDLEDIDQRLEDRDRELDAKREEIAELEVELDELQARRKEMDAADGDGRLVELRERRADLRAEQADAEDGVERLEHAIERLEGQLEDVEDEIEETKTSIEGADVESLKRERAEVRSELEDVEARLDVLQPLLTANREMLDSDLTGVFGYEAGLTGDQFTCWSCGQPAEAESFEETIDQLRDLIEQDKKMLRDREPELAELDEKIESAKRARSRQQELVTKRRDLEQQLAERRESLSERRSQLEELKTDIQSVDEDIAEAEAEQTATDDGVTAEIEATRVEIRSLRREIDRIEEAREKLTNDRREREEARDRVAELDEEIAALTDRIENLESELRENFNEAMDDLLQVLDFERIERVWLDGNFDLVIARDTDESVRADTVEHLAESEREMLGLVLGLAGFLTYDVGEVVPMLVLDSLGAFDSERTERLIDYFADRTDALIAAVHATTPDGESYDTISVDQRVTR
jgi:predicted  nucleic acid-binding Zn-ribbon protein